MSPLAQMTFFSVGFANLHQLVLLQLADTETGSRHPVLPLLHVSRYWRAFARDFLLEPYQNTKIVSDSNSEHEDSGDEYLIPVLTGEAYVKFTLTGFCTADMAYVTDDPRFYFCEEGEEMPCIIMLLESCDPSTLMCTFVPAGSAEGEAGAFADLEFPFHCNAETKRTYSDTTPSFAIAASTWFAERTPGSGLWGQDLLFAPGWYPDPNPFTFCPLLQEPGERVDLKRERNKWSADFSVVRLDVPHKKESDWVGTGFYEASALLMMRTVTVPLAVLYRPDNISEDPQYG